MPSYTWSPQVAMSKEEIDSFLNEKNIARVATIRPDGTIHMSPLWYYWDGANIYLWLGSGERPRQHIRNLEKNPNITVLIDRDVRPEVGSLEPGAQAVLIRGYGRLIRDPDMQVTVGMKILTRLFGPDGERYLNAALGDGKPGMNRVVVKVEPVKIIAWDFRKLRKARRG
jgi:nitroimidazol reductase NimA-like FMN-containing flavoprotein (pyridoxamine 5'-phosphate oxidase superfamily)